MSMAQGFYMDGNTLSAGNAIGALEITPTNTADIIFPPIRLPRGGLGLFKAIKLRVSTNASSSLPMTLSVYKKGNMPKDVSDSPDYTVTANVPNGDYIFNLPHIVTEELIIRLKFTLQNTYTSTIENELGNAKIRYLGSPKIRILGMWIDIEEYGDVGNIHEGEWRP